MPGEHGDGGHQWPEDGSMPGMDSGPPSQDGGDTDASPPGEPFGIAERPHNATCVAPQKPAEGKLSVTRAFKKLSFDHPVGLYQPKGDDTYFYVIEQYTGAIKRFPNKDDVSPREVQTLVNLGVQGDGGGDERGLLGFAFDPQFADNHFIYVALTPDAEGEELYDEIHRYTVSSDGSKIDASSKLLIYSVRDPYANHNGGGIAFGPDGFLYYGLGDGGGGDDQHCFAHDPMIPFGKFHRFDVHKAENGKNYGIPPGNPYAKGGGLPEVYTIGMRNPWRWSFDRDTGDLWAGDVGQDAFEEIDRIELGKNYGWKAMEGFSCFRDLICEPSDLYPGRKVPPLPKCNAAELTKPVYAYGRDVGATVVGGYVYRGPDIPDLLGTYLYADFGTGDISGLTQNGKGEYESKRLIHTDFNISSFGEDNQGRVYVLDWRGPEEAGGDPHLLGGIYRIAPPAQMAADTLPKRLSQTGCVDASDVTKPVAAMIPYAVRVPFWSDGAEKQRWFAIPDGKKISVQDDGDFELPPGSVAMKLFTLGGKRVETRFYVRWDDGTYGGYTYRWDEDGKDATLLTSALTVQAGGASWYYPSRTECTRCHAGAANGHLGIEASQLNSEFAYALRPANQLATLAHIDMLLGADASKFAGLPLPSDETVPEDTRARAYLQANCAHCHRPGGSGRGAMDMRFHAADPKLCNEDPRQGDLGIAGAKIVVPGHAEQSLLYVRMSQRGDTGMPPLASSVVDEKGAALLKQWITQLKTCP